MSTTRPATCPSWCQLDHGREPADRHTGTVQLGTDASGVDVHLSQLPGEPGTGVALIPVGLTDSTDEGLGLSLDAGLTVELARVLVNA
jgi:hypothetical protein